MEWLRKPTNSVSARRDEKVIIKKDYVAVSTNWIGRHPFVKFFGKVSSILTLGTKGGNRSPSLRTATKNLKISKNYNIIFM